MPFEIKLKAGFFKTRRCYLTIGQKRIVLAPQDTDEREQLIIDDNILKFVYIIRRGLSAGEIEIVTQSGSYIGNFLPQTSMEEVCQVLAREFGDKFIIQ